MYCLQQHCKFGPLDLSACFNYTTFDFVGDLAFGESFGCLKNSQADPWFKMIVKTAHLGTLLQTASHLPRVKEYLLPLIPTSVRNKRNKHRLSTREELLKRLQMYKDCPDLIEGLIRGKDNPVSLSYEFSCHPSLHHAHDASQVLHFQKI